METSSTHVLCCAAKTISLSFIIPSYTFLSACVEYGDESRATWSWGWRRICIAGSQQCFWATWHTAKCSIRSLCMLHIFYIEIGWKLLTLCSVWSNFVKLWSADEGFCAFLQVLRHIIALKVLVLFFFFWFLHVDSFLVPSDLITFCFFPYL